MPTISVIVPVYKAEQYLVRCVESIRNQTFSDLEIILVDDGSPDNCGAICDEYAAKDTRITVIHKENGGLSDARNVGLDIARGEYIGFVDSDDWIYPKMYEVLYRSAVEDGSGMVTFAGFQECVSEVPEDAGVREIVSAADALARFSQIYYKRIWTTVQTKLYHRRIFETLRFTKGIIYEDQDILPQSVMLAGQVSILPYSMYYYRLSQDSIMRSAFSAKRYVKLDVLQRYVTFFQSLGLEQQRDYYAIEYLYTAVKFSQLTRKKHPEFKKQFSSFLDKYQKFRPWLCKNCRFSIRQRVLLALFPHMNILADRVYGQLQGGTSE